MTQENTKGGAPGPDDECQECGHGEVFHRLQIDGGSCGGSTSDGRCNCRRKPAAPPPRAEAAPGPALPAEMLAVLRNPDVPLAGEGDAINACLTRACKPCLTSERPYWHPAGTPCPKSGPTAPAPVPGAREEDDR